MTKYIPVGKTTKRQKAVKLIKFQLIAVSLLLNLFLAKQLYNIECSEGGYFMSKVRCAEIAQARFDARELARLELAEVLANERNDYEQ